MAACSFITTAERAQRAPERYPVARNWLRERHSARLNLVEEKPGLFSQPFIANRVKRAFDWSHRSPLFLSRITEDRSFQPWCVSDSRFSSTSSNVVLRFPPRGKLPPTWPHSVYGSMFCRTRCFLAAQSREQATPARSWDSSATTATLVHTFGAGFIYRTWAKSIYTRIAISFSVARRLP